MLRKFSTENFRGFNGKITLDLSTTSNYEFNTELIKDNIINKAIFFGNNGSGKTNVCLAIADIVSVLSVNEASSLFQKRPRYKNLNNPFSKTVNFEYELTSGEDIVVYRYSKIDFQTLFSEELVLNGKTIINCVYNQNNLPVNVNVDYERLPLFKGSIPEFYGNRSSIVKFIIYSIAASNYQFLIDLKTFANGILWFRCLRENEYIGYKTGIDQIDSVIADHNELTSFELFLKKNGLNYELVSKVVNGQKHIYAKFKNGETGLFDITSSGTESLTLFYSWLVQLKERVPSLVLIDEFDAYYHFKSAELVYKMLSERREFQSILTSHNTYLMKNSITRPDCVYLIFDNRVIKNLPNCVDDNKELREAHNLEKIYRNGGFCE